MEQERQFPVIGSKAPEFVADTTKGTIHFPQDYKGKWVIFFSHPADFTPVCSTEFMTFASMADDLRDNLNTELVGLSVDSLHSHIAWLRSLEGFCWNGIEKQKIDFPLVVDIKMEVAYKYGMIQGESDTNAVRAVFIIDPESTIRTILYYPSSTGRNMDEIRRVLVALQKADNEKIATPANWNAGDPVIIPPPRTQQDAIDRVGMKDNEGINQLDWFLTFKDEK